VDEHPIRVVVDSTARIPHSAAILHKGAGKRIIAVSNRANLSTIEVLKKYADVLVCGENKVDLGILLDKLGAIGIQRIMVEGGGTLIAGLVSEGLVNEIYTFIGNIIIGGKDAPTLTDGEGFIHESDFARLTLVEARRMERGILLHWTVENPDRS
jgi:2,5-diamino-6-(ribosylamino)-4(3H)-pyrimidinone 5'-phosphate reductase